ncbi:MAG TPA: hypothetical protein VH682_14065, partial [Gemmataceae bacterium]
MGRFIGRQFVRLRFIFLVRYAVLVGLLLPGLVILALWGNPDLFGNLLVLETPWQLFNVTWLSFLVAAFVLIACRVIRINAGSRFADYQTALMVYFPPPPGGAPPPTRWWPRLLLLILLGLTVPVACVIAIQADPSPAWESAAWFHLPWLLGTLIVSGGLLFAILLLCLLTALQQVLLAPEVNDPNLLPFEKWWPFSRLHNVRLKWLYPIGDWLAWILKHLGHGYTQSFTDSTTKKTYLALAPGHSQAFLWLGATLVVYLGSYALVYNAALIPGETSPFAALFFVLLLFLLAGCLLTGLSFLLDYTRFPVLLAVAGLSLGVYAFFDTDHYYELNPGGAGASPIADLGLTDAFEQRQFPQVVPSAASQEKRRTLVVVTAAGGGIQASAWTTQVLSGLDDIYGPDFTRSIGLISATSGGSVGTMYYLANGSWSGDGSPFDEPARQRMREMSLTSNLEGTAWGVTHPDLMRVFTPFLVPKYADRGWASEAVWRKELSPLGGGWQNGDFRLRDWIEPIRKGEMPIPIFNATLVESGQRLILSPVRGHSGPTNATEARELFDLYSSEEANPRVTTAVRLSAAFPYVSPVSCPYRETPQVSDYHVADGGYADNEGAVVVIEWVYKLLKYYRQPENQGKRPFDRILIVRIVPFPIEQEAKPAEAHKGWLYELLGPLTTIEQVRAASQAERISLALELLNDATLPDVSEKVRQERKQGEDILAKAELQRLRANLHQNQVRALPKGAAKEQDALQAKADAAGKEGEQLVQKGARLLRSIAGEMEITWTEFVFQPKKKALIPLSWKLTP